LPELCLQEDFRLPCLFLSRAALAPFAVMLLSAIPAAAEGRVWLADGDEEVATLIYGTPESDDMLLSFTCERASKIVTVWFALQQVPPKTPDSLPLTLASAAGHIELKAEGTHSQMDDSYSLQAQTPLTPELEKTLTGARLLTVKVEKQNTEVPLDDAALRGAEKLVAACHK
jgi:hypothetical protein